MQKFEMFELTNFRRAAAQAMGPAACCTSLYRAVVMCCSQNCLELGTRHCVVQKTHSWRRVWLLRERGQGQRVGRAGKEKTEDHLTVKPDHLRCISQP